MDELDADGLVIWPAAERNKQPIVEALLTIVPQGHGKILEISAATGQHAEHFAPHFPGYDYYVSDCDPLHIESLGKRLRLGRCPNLMGPLKIDTTESKWPLERVEVVYNANMMHIAPWAAAVGLFSGAARILPLGGLLVTYGPYKIGGVHTSDSNERFDASLRARNEQWGVRDLDELKVVGLSHGLEFVEKRAMPANNFLLVFRRIEVA